MDFHCYCHPTYQKWELEIPFLDFFSPKMTKKSMNIGDTNYNQLFAIIFDGYSRCSFIGGGGGTVVDSSDTLKE